MNAHAGPALAGYGLHRTYGRGPHAVHALDGVDIEAHRGELTVVTGPSGSGKTTLLNIIGGLDRPDAGRVVLGDGRVLHDLRPEEVLALRRRDIGHVFQDFGLLPVLSAAENVGVPLRLLRVAPAERETRVADMLNRVGLQRHAHQRPAELSGGQQQRVGVARALVADPDILIADEPTGQLDSETAASIMDLMLELTRGRGLSVVVATHDASLVERADRVLRLLDGRLLLS